ncbi:MAG: hypothetical protein IKB73_07855 [Ruminococcus sp.]|nr:hypothetical protein [Ruminococcus sp.]
MKRIVSILLVAVMLITLGAITASAQTEDKELLFEDKLNEFTDGMYSYYDELYYHYDESGEMDWALLYVVSPSAASIMHVIFSDMVIWSPEVNIPFGVNYGIYDVKKDEFVRLYDIEPDDYEGLEDVLREQAKQFIKPLGDADKDNVLTILDATFIQRVMANLDKFDYRDEFNYGPALLKTSYLSDLDLDGERTVMDATAIQMKLAGIE